MDESQRQLALSKAVERTRRDARSDPRFGNLGLLQGRFDQAIAKLGVGAEQAARLRGSAVLRLDLRPAHGDMASAGVSQLGGEPELPANFKWPEVDKGPMWLWLQLDLEAIPELPDALLPNRGRLLVFVGTGKYPDSPEVRVEWLEEGPFSPRAQPSLNEDEEDFLWPPEVAPIAASLGIELPSYWRYSIVRDALLDHTDDELVKSIFDEVGHPAKLCILPHQEDDHWAAVEDGREPQRPEAWLPLVSTSYDGLWDPMSTALMIHRDDLRKRDFSRVRLYIYNAS